MLSKLSNRCRNRGNDHSHRIASAEQAGGGREGGASPPGGGAPACGFPAGWWRCCSRWGPAQHHLVGQAVEPVERHRPQLTHPAQLHQLARAQVRRRQEEEADRQRQKAVIPQLRAVVRLLLRRAAGVADRPRAAVAAVLTATEVAIDQSSVGAITAAFGSDQSGTTGVVDGESLTASANAGSKLPSGSSGFVPRRIVEPCLNPPRSTG